VRPCPLSITVPHTPYRSDPMLEPLMQSVLDPFDAYGPTKSEDQIFSILPPLSIANNRPSTIRGPSPSPPVLNGNVHGNNGSYYDQATPSTLHASQSWNDGAANEWSSTASSSTEDVRRYSVPSSPARRPSSPPSTDTLRRGNTKARPSVINVEDVLSSDTVRSLEVPLTPRRDSSRRDTIMAARPAIPQPYDTAATDETIRFNTTDNKQPPTTPARKQGFSISRLISPSTTSTGGVSKG
jgi:hypothetical protein